MKLYFPCKKKKKAVSVAALSKPTTPLRMFRTSPTRPSSTSSKCSAPPVTPSFSCFWAWSWSMTSTSGTPASSFGHSSCASSSDSWVYHHRVSMTEQFEHLKLISFWVTLPDTINVPPLLLLLLFLLGVFILTAIANRFRLKPVNLQEQFIMAYGGLRGAVSFSLVEMLLPSVIHPRQMFVTTTLAVILFTVFIQVKIIC